MKEARSGMLARAEAFPLPWEDLTDDQQSVVKSVAQVFGELAEQRWEAPQKQGAFDRIPLRFDADRRSHVALIEGERGFGRTAFRPVEQLRARPAADRDHDGRENDSARGGARGALRAMVAAHDPEGSAPSPGCREHG